MKYLINLWKYNIKFVFLISKQHLTRTWINSDPDNNTVLEFLHTHVYGISLAIFNYRDDNTLFMRG